MSPRKPTGKPPGRPRGPRRVLLLVRLDPRQAAVIRAEAKRRQKASGTLQPDVSAVIRELLDEAWWARQGR
jgi:hypothetical protein